MFTIIVLLGGQGEGTKLSAIHPADFPQHVVFRYTVAFFLKLTVRYMMFKLLTAVFTVNTGGLCMAKNGSGHWIQDNVLNVVIAESGKSAG